MNLLAWLDRNAGRILGIALVLAALAALLALAGCGDVPPPRGSAQGQAAEATARADSTVRAADAAEIDAAGLDAKAKHLEQQAVQDPTPARIQAAADARVEAASALAVAAALRRQADAAAVAAATAAERARLERESDARAAEDRAWVKLTRLVGLVGVGVGALVGGAIALLVNPRLGILTGLLVAGTGALCSAYGEAYRWLPLALGGGLVLSLVAWALAHYRVGRVGVALSRALDAAEAEPHPDLADEQDQAKAALAKAITAAGLKGRFERLRGGTPGKRTWGRKATA